VLVYFLNHSTAPVSLGGAERSLVRLVEDWYASDPEFEAFFLTKYPKGQAVAAFEERGWKYDAVRFRGWAGPVAEPPSSQVAYFARDDYAAVSHFIRLMEKRRPDLVVTNTVVAPWAAFAAKVLGIPHVWLVREYGDLDHGLHFHTGREATFSDIGLLSELVVTNSLALRDHIEPFIPAEKIAVLYPQVDIAAVEKRSTERPATNPFPARDGLRIVVVGRLAESKGQWRVIDAMVALRDRGIDASLCLVGAAPETGYESELRARVRAAGLGERVVFAGEQSNPFPFIAAADVAVTPSGIEAFGRSTLEYMIVGKPVLATNRGGSAELVVPGTTGEVFAPEDGGALVDALARYAADPALIAAHGLAGSSRAHALLGGEHGNAAIIERMVATATLPSYRLPEIARYWFDLPRRYYEVSEVGNRVTARFLATRVLGRAYGIARRPLGFVKRMIGK
jgi:glycosyltransferase involved in cell wall biosynthesis